MTRPLLVVGFSIVALCWLADAFVVSAAAAKVDHQSHVIYLT